MEAKYGDMFHPKKENWEEIKGDIVFEDVSFRYPDGKEYVLEHFNLHVPAGTYGDMFHPKKENWEEIKGDIVFEDVSFRYPDGKEYVLEHFNLHVPAGTNVAIVGETGAGKSTLVNLLGRFFEPTKGRILIDGKDYRLRSQLWLHSNVAIVGETGAGKSTLVNLLGRFFEPTKGRILIDGKDYRLRSQLWLHSQIGYVLQNPHLFSGTLYDNIRYGNLDATDEEIREAARQVSADTVAEKLEKGYDSDVGESGGRLSTGEKQLISFARAILANPRIFVLDEATSSIDTQTEQLIQKATDHLLKGHTSFVIAHRLSTIRKADVILVVKDGKIIEQGSHRELLNKKGDHLLKGHTSFVIAHRLSTIRKADVILVVKDGKIIEQGSHRELLNKKGYYYELYSKQFEEEVAMGILSGQKK